MAIPVVNDDDGIACKSSTGRHFVAHLPIERNKEQQGIFETLVFPAARSESHQPYGKRGKRNHSGVDIKTKDRDSIYAAFDGEVVFSKPYHGYGNLVRIKHANGLETYYSHNSENLVKEGQHVKAGQVIALVGQTGRATTPHLHFEIRVNGKTRNPADYFDFKKHVYRKR